MKLIFFRRRYFKLFKQTIIRDLKIKLLLKQNIELERPTLKSRTRPISALRKSVKQMQEYEGNNMPLSTEFRDGWKPTPKPRTKKAPITVRRTEIEEKSKALKGYIPHHLKLV